MSQLQAVYFAIAEPILKEFLPNFFGQERYKIIDFFSPDSQLYINNDHVIGKMEVAQKLKEIPICSHNIISFDIQKVLDLATLNYFICTSDGIMILQNQMLKYHASFAIKTDNKCNKAFIDCMTISF